METLRPKPGQTTAMSEAEPMAATLPAVDKPFGKALIALAQQRSDIVGLTADLGKYTDLDIFGVHFPDRYFQVGMAEQNLIGIAAGLAHVGYVPFATTYCVFAARRAYDFIAIDVAYPRANVKIIAGLPGLTTGYGATHQGIDDLALMRAIPNMTVIDPCDATEIQQAVVALAQYHGPVYMRLLRGKVKRVFEDKTYQFEIGKGKILRKGQDLLLVSTGLMTDRALQAADGLAEEGIQARVLHLSTLKPFDSETLLEATSGLKALVTLENHSTIGGLGSAVADALSQAGVHIRLTKIGIPDCFVECGSVDYLTEKYGLSVASIIRTARQLL
ncbi:MAG: transketolase C-terminal domain-containing protein [Terriglobia bacterium]